MKAVVLDKITEGKDVVLSDVPIPAVVPGWVLVKVKAFGLNHSEKLLRLSEIRADYIQKPIIPGIECVGKIADPSDSGLAVGQKVVALMGGMGRSFHGSYAEYAFLPRRIVFPVESDLPWDALGAVPETYFTAWGSLFECLHLTAKDTLLIRGATCALGYASLQIAKALGCKVIATTHREDTKSTGTYSDNIKKLKDALADADAVVIGAGAGLSTSAGFIYNGERFEKYFSDFAARYRFADMYSGGFYPYATQEEFWAYWSRYIWVNRYMDAPKPVYEELFRLAENKDYFVITVDALHDTAPPTAEEAAESVNRVAQALERFEKPTARRCICSV